MDGQELKYAALAGPADRMSSRLPWTCAWPAQASERLADFLGRWEAPCPRKSTRLLNRFNADWVLNLFESLVDFRGHGASQGPLASGRAPTAAQGPPASRDCSSVGGGPTKPGR